MGGLDYLLQVVVTVWIGVHPVTYTLPKLYANNTGACQRYADFLMTKRKPSKVRMVIECVPTNGREA
jgi:hypothetical protein